MKCFGLILSLAASSFVTAQPTTPNMVQSGPPWNLMPVPAKIQPGSGQWIPQQGFTISVNGADDPRVLGAAQRFVEHLTRATGISLHYQAGEPGKATIAIRCEHAGDKIQKLGEDESYVLDVTDAGVKLSAPNPLGIIHGLQTLLQLVSPGPQGFAAPAVHIEDAPRFQWRGLLLDSCRHWMPV
ncbi:MAG TPA: glycoside hydrolase family 20 zincin-like fold domain-containing protein, partial [Terriglobales bacterium]|nr:glycoside hydrolase family 20 zincin-like fold domain-containing protein [Terriglobales bacterium]